MPDDLGKVTEATITRIRDHGFTGAATRFFDPLSATKESVTRLRDIMATGGVDPCQAVAAHRDLLAASPEVRSEGVRAMQHMCRVTQWLGAGNLYVRPGSRNPAGSWYPHPDNFTDEAFSTLVDSLRQVCAAAEEYGITLAVEGHTLSILDTPERIRELIETVGSPTLRFNADPVNFVSSLREAYDTTTMINRMFDVLGEYTICGHAKDFYVQDRLVLHMEEAAVGEGLLDQETFLRRFEEACPDGYVQIEHLPDDKIPAARESLFNTGIAAGIAWKVLP
jgi:sugar phosphate isomerase/epimerase